MEDRVSPRTVDSAVWCLSCVYAYVASARTKAICKKSTGTQARARGAFHVVKWFIQNTEYTSYYHRERFAGGASPNALATLASIWLVTTCSTSAWQFGHFFFRCMAFCRHRLQKLCWQGCAVAGLRMTSRQMLHIISSESAFIVRDASPGLHPSNSSVWMHGEIS